MQATAQQILSRCEAASVLEITVDSQQLIRIKVLKNPDERTEAETLAIRCVGRQSAATIDFRPVADLLLTAKKTDEL